MSGARPAPLRVEAWRLFVAVEVPEGVRDALEQRLRPLRKTHPEARWTAAETFHLTVAFLGDTPTDAVPALAKALAEAARRHAPFVFSLARSGSFGHGPRRVAWFGAGDGAGAWQALAADVERVLRPWLPEERPTGEETHAHLTVARHANPELPALLERATAGLRAVWRVEEVALVRSRLGPAGASHEVLQRFRLGPRASAPRS